MKKKQIMAMALAAVMLVGCGSAGTQQEAAQSSAPEKTEAAAESAGGDASGGGNNDYDGRISYESGAYGSNP